MAGQSGTHRAQGTEPEGPAKHRGTLAPYAKLAKSTGPRKLPSVNERSTHTNKFLSPSLSLCFPSSTVTTIAAFLCSHYRLVPLEAWSCNANEKFGVIFNHYTHASLLAAGPDDLPVRVWRASVCNWHQKSRTPGFCDLSGSSRLRMFLWEGRCEDRVCPSGYVTLVRYAAWLNPCSCCHDKRRKRTQFDSDYSGGNGASTPLFLQVSVYLSLKLWEWILLTDASGHITYYLHGKLDAHSKPLKEGGLSIWHKDQRIRNNCRRIFQGFNSVHVPSRFKPRVME